VDFLPLRTGCSGESVPDRLWRQPRALNMLPNCSARAITRWQQVRQAMSGARLGWRLPEKCSSSDLSAEPVEYLRDNHLTPEGSSISRQIPIKTVAVAFLAATRSLSNRGTHSGGGRVVLAVTRHRGWYDGAAFFEQSRSAACEAAGIRPGGAASPGVLARAIFLML